MSFDDSEFFESTNTPQINTEKVDISELKHGFVSDELRRLCVNQKKEYGTDVIVDKHIHVKLNDSKNVKFDIKLHSTLYPFFPPEIVFITKFDADTGIKLHNLRMVQLKYWNPTRTLDYIINNIRQIVAKHGIVQTNEYDIMMNLNIDIDDLDNNVYPITKQLLDKQTGEWDVAKYLKVQEETDTYIIKQINRSRDMIEDTVPNIILYYIKQQITGITLLDIDSRQPLYDSIFSLLLLIAKKDSSLLTNNIVFNGKTYDSLHTDIISLHSDMISTKTHCKSFKIIIAIHGMLVSDVKTKTDTKTYNNDYEKQLTKHRFEEYDSKESGFSYPDVKQKSNMTRIMSELSNLRKNLVIMYDSSIFVKYDPNRINNLSVMITGPKKTPYDHGCFLFDVQLPAEYPNTNPSVKFLTTGYGKVRFNPNLYELGKVCLSLLGTWRGSGGEVWNPKLSTIQQVLVSIQSLILVEQPYFNEPGFEKSMNTLIGKNASKSYNEQIRLYTMKHAIIEYLLKPKNEWKDIMYKHFALKKKDILQTCKTWMNSSKSLKPQYEAAYKLMCDTFEKVNL